MLQLPDDITLSAQQPLQAQHDCLVDITLTAREVPRDAPVDGQLFVDFVGATQTTHQEAGRDDRHAIQLTRVE